MAQARILNPSGTVLAAALALGCSAPADQAATPPAGKIPQDAKLDGLYHDFLDGKYDGNGHPIGAIVWQAESDCAFSTGTREAEGVGFRVGTHTSGSACEATSTSVGKGRFTLNARALVESACRDAACDPMRPVFTIRAAGQDGTEIASRIVRWGDFAEDLTFKNASFSFTHVDETPVVLSVHWEGEVNARLDYVELFRSSRNLIVTPPSGIPASGDAFVVEALAPPTGATLAARCDDVDLTSTLAALLTAGTATREDTEFRTTYTIPVDALTGGCALPTRVRFSLMTNGQVREAARVTLFAEAAPCTFMPGTTRVLLTGFEPFPADSTRDNSSEEAVSAFDETSVPGVSVMRLTLPVEFDTAPDVALDVVARCAPDIVIGFGQGRSKVDVELTAYNRKDSADVAGGVPDNRGIVAAGDSIIDGGSAELSTGLPADAISSALAAQGISAGPSTDPGRYVCNNLFYRLMAEAQTSGRIAGFVHLPRIPVVDDADRAMLGSVVTTVVTHAKGPSGG